MPPQDCVIVGAGIHGLCTAFWLRRRGLQRLVVLDQHAPGHGHGSSHGATRITRSSYDDPAFVRLAQRAHRDGWPALERELGTTLRLPTPGLFFGPEHGLFAGYRAATRAVGADVTPIPVAEARRRFPLLRFDEHDGVLLDRSAAVLLAEVTMTALRAWLSARGVDLRWRTPALAVRPHPAGIEVATPGGALVARHAVLACGPWTGRLHGQGVPPLQVVRQQVGYFAVDAEPSACAPGRFPVWVRLGLTADDFTYGLPSLAGSGLKAAVHRTQGPGGDPDAPAPEPDEAALLALARARLGCAVQRLVRHETCLYTMAPGQQLHVLRAPDLPLTTIAACSGHAFKFGPVIGEEAAAQVLAR